MARKQQILIVEDDVVLNNLMADHLQAAGYRAHSAISWASAKAILQKEEPDLILLDIRLPDGDGMKLLEEVSTRQPVIVITSYGSVQQAVQVMKIGAADYLAKPVNLDELDFIINRVLDTAKLRREHSFLKTQAVKQDTATLVGSSAAMLHVNSLISSIAPSDMTVLILGESGTGKEVVARAIHNASARAGENFVAVDCCTIPGQLFEAELFGYEKGAFTGAFQMKRGLIESAENGTLFLDEIGDVELAGQAKLLRFLETGTYRRVGGVRDLQVNVRVITATNRDLDAMTKDKEFRTDLFYRLSAFVIGLPALAERKEDLPELIEYFISKGPAANRIKKRVSAEVTNIMNSYSWPGNVRELRNVVERALILSGEEEVIKPLHLGFKDLDIKLDEKTTLCFEHEPTMKEIEGLYLKQLLAKYNGSRAQVAAAMGVSERTLYRMIQRHDIHTEKEAWEEDAAPSAKLR